MARGVTLRGFQRRNSVARAWFRAMPNQLPQRVQYAYNAQISGLVQQSALWAKIGALYWFGTTTGTSALFDIKSPSGTAPTTVNTPGFTRMKGFTGNGVNGYIDFNRAWSAMPNYAQDNAHAMAAGIIGSNTITVGTLTANYTSIGRGGGNLSARLNAGAAVTGAALTASVFYILGVTRSVAANYDRYIDGVLDGNSVSASAALSANNALALSNVGTFAGASTRVSGVSFGAALTATEMKMLDTFFRNMAYGCGATV